MSEDVRRFKDVGTRLLFETLVFDVFKHGGPVTTNSIIQYCSSTVYGCSRHVKPTLELLAWLGFVDSSNQSYAPTNRLKGVANDGRGFPLALVEHVLVALGADLASMIGSGSAVIQGKDESRAYLSTSYITTSWLPFVVFLRNLGLLKDGSNDHALLVITPALAPLLLKHISKSQEEMGWTTRGYSIERLFMRQDAQTAQGEAAEAFVVEYEKARMVSHPRLETIKAISATHADAGFDVLSYSTESSLTYDRFIEVKSYKGERRFFWSRGEYEAALQRRESYFIYLVDATKMHDLGYQPEIIRDPARIFQQVDVWTTTPMNWLVSGL